MKTQKALSVVVEVVVMEDGQCVYIMRNAQTGMPINIVATPAELQAVFCELSKPAKDQESKPQA